MRYVDGDVTEPIGPGIVAHVCNDVGVMGAGVALAIRNKWPEAFRQYYRTFLEDGLELGNVVYAEPPGYQIVVANMIAQRGIRSERNRIPLDYEALDVCLRRVSLYFGPFEQQQVHMPMIGSGLAGGDWDRISEMIEHRIPDAIIYRYQP